MNTNSITAYELSELEQSLITPEVLSDFRLFLIEEFNGDADLFYKWGKVILSFRIKNSDRCSYLKEALHKMIKNN